MPFSLSPYLSEQTKVVQCAVLHYYCASTSSRAVGGGGEGKNSKREELAEKCVCVAFDWLASSGSL